jgi:hypothetical protein
MQPRYAELTDQMIRTVGGSTALAEDDEFYSLNLATFRPGGGFGVTGPLVVVPALILALLQLARGRVKGDPAQCSLIGLTIFVVASFLVFCVVLRTQKIGVFRLMFSCFIVAVPLTTLLLRARVGPCIAAGSAFVALLLSVSAAASFWAFRFQIPQLRPLAAMKRTAPEQVSVSWDGKPAETFTLREPYTKRELYLAVLPKVEHDATVGFIGRFHSEGYHCFGPTFTRKVIPLNDSRSDEIFRPPPAVTHIFLEDRDYREIPPDVFEGFRLLFAASQRGSHFFAVFEREAPGLGP